VSNVKRYLKLKTSVMTIQGFMLEKRLNSYIVQDLVKYSYKSKKMKNIVQKMKDTKQNSWNFGKI
jgi:uncharacterized UBP type Zn finger protein